MTSPERSARSYSSQRRTAHGPGRLLSLAGVGLLLGACTQELPPRTTIDLMQEPAVLEAVIRRCEELGKGATSDPECLNAREAVDRIAVQAAEDRKPDEVAQTQSEFERAREERRQRDEQERRLREAQEKVDPYTMPLVEEPAGTSAQTPVPTPAPSESDPSAS